MVNNIVNNFRYTESAMTKKDFLSYFKAYAKKILDILVEQGTSEENINSFKKESGNFAKFINENFDNAEFYMSEKGLSVDASTMGIAIWDDSCTDGPNFYYLKQGLKEQKM